MKAKKPNQKLQAWIDARKRHHLSHAQVQMARELGWLQHVADIRRSLGRIMEDVLHLLRLGWDRAYLHG